MYQFFATALNGLTLGAVFAAFALALCLIWRSTRIVNFAQAPMAMLTTFVALVIIQAGYSYWLGFVVALATGFLLGAFVERVVIRPVEGKGDLNAVIVTLGLLVAIEGIAAIIFGSQQEAFPTPFGVAGIEIGGRTIPINGFEIFTLVAVGVVMALLVVLFRWTDIGLRMRAAAFSPEVARLLGVRVGRMLTLGWALAAVAGSLSGLLIAGGQLIDPAYMHGVVIFGFVAAVLGGLDSPVGSVVGGMLLGMSLSFVSGYVDSGLTSVTALVILVAVLLLKPGGLFGTAEGRRV